MQDTTSEISPSFADAGNNFDPIAYINDPRWHSSHYGLERIEALLDRMGNPQEKMKFVHVAGTNGKGSTCSYLSQILLESGYRVGLFTSPYIIRFEERIQVDGTMIAPDELLAVTLFVRSCAEELATEMGEHATEFELMTAVAIEHFARSRCDVAILEVGLGGSLDSTNVIPAPEVCAIARIGLDHTEILGSTKAEIAAQKAGIIKKGASVVSYPQDDAGATAAIAEAAKAAEVEQVRIPDFAQLAVGGLNEAGMREFSYKGQAYQTALLGSYQPNNATLAIECAMALRERGWKVSDENIVQGIAHTRWQARFEIVEAAANRPTIIVDGGHNSQGATVLAESLENLFPTVKPLFVMGVLGDKDYRGMLDAVINRAAGFVCITPDNPRALTAADLAKTIEQEALARGIALDKGVVAVGSAEAAFAKARSLSGAGDVICAFGSLYSIASVKEAIAKTADCAK